MRCRHPQVPAGDRQSHPRRLARRGVWAPEPQRLSALRTLSGVAPVTKRSGKSTSSTCATRHMQGYATRSFIGRGQPSRTTPRAAVATPLCASAVIPMAAPSVASRTDSCRWHVSSCSDRRCSILIAANQRRHELRHPFVRLTSTSLRPDLPGGRAPSASVVPDAAPRHRREPARSVLDDASTVL